MATNYPTALDVFADHIASDPVYAAHVVNLQDSCRELQEKVGIDQSATVSTLDYRVNQFIVASTYLFFYENSAPTGWTATLPAGDRVLGVVGDAGDWNVAGQTPTAGTWDLSSDMNSGSHNHVWMYYSGGISYTYNSGGTAVQYGTPTVGIGGSDSLLSNLHTKNTKADTRQLVYNTTAYVDTSSHTHTFTAGWRPTSAVGVIAYYSGP
jgi:hypothetical protein